MLLNAKVGHFNTEFMKADFLFLIFIYFEVASKGTDFFFYFIFFIFF